MPRKKYFSPREIIVIAGFLNNLKEHHIFSEFKHGFCDKMKKKNVVPKRVVKEAHFPFLFFLFFIVSQNACLNFFETAFDLSVNRKYGKKV